MAQPKDDRLDRVRVFNHHALPIIDTPFTRLSEHWFTRQHGPCRDWEMDYMRCSSRVGHKHEETLCQKYFEDWRECVYKTKTALRYEAMHNERVRQGAAFKKPPPPDSVDVPVY